MAFSVDVTNDFLTPDESDILFRKIMSNPSHFTFSKQTKTGAPSKKRNKTIYGSRSTYEFEYRGKLVRTPIRPWESFPELKDIADRIASVSGQTASFNTCVIQIYTTGVVGIKPHRDKEMKPNTIIASVSLEATRTMRFEKVGERPRDFPLVAGSLCLIRPPTNNWWQHSIPVEDHVKGARISLIFRLF